jgi:hypothetical protein
MFENVEFKTLPIGYTQSKGGNGESFVRLTKIGGGISLRFSKKARFLLEQITPGFNDFELLASRNEAFALKPLVNGNKAVIDYFTVTSLNNWLSDLPIGDRIDAVVWNGMLVCDLRKSL